MLHPPCCSGYNPDVVPHFLFLNPTVAPLPSSISHDEQDLTPLLTFSGYLRANSIHQRSQEYLNSSQPGTWDMLLLPWFLFLPATTCRPGRSSIQPLCSILIPGTHLRHLSCYPISGMVTSILPISIPRNPTYLYPVFPLSQQFSPGVDARPSHLHLCPSIRSPPSRLPTPERIPSQSYPGRSPSPLRSTYSVSRRSTIIAYFLTYRSHYSYPSTQGNMP